MVLPVKVYVDSLQRGSKKKEFRVEWIKQLSPNELHYWRSKLIFSVRHNTQVPTFLNSSSCANVQRNCSGSCAGGKGSLTIQIEQMHLAHGELMRNAVIRWNPATREYFCALCGRTSDAISDQDARERLERYECQIPSVDTSVPSPGSETVRLIKKRQ
jgi:hypothetical protein